MRPAKLALAVRTAWVYEQYRALLMSYLPLCRILPGAPFYTREGLFSTGIRSLRAPQPVSGVKRSPSRTKGNNADEKEGQKHHCTSKKRV